MLRIAEERDVPAMLAVYAPYVRGTTVSFEYEPPAPADFLARFREITAAFPWLVWEENGEILGYAYGSAPFARAAFRWCAEDSVYLRPDAQGRGIGRRLCLALEAILARQGYRVVYAIVTSENTASLAFHGRLGYRVTAELPACGFKFGRWLGVTWLEKRLYPGDMSMDFPASWPELVKDAQSFSDILDNFSLSESGKI